MNSWFFFRNSLGDLSFFLKINPCRIVFLLSNFQINLPTCAAARMKNYYDYKPLSCSPINMLQNETLWVLLDHSICDQLWVGPLRAREVTSLHYSEDDGWWWILGWHLHSFACWEEAGASEAFCWIQGEFFPGTLYKFFVCMWVWRWCIMCPRNAALIRS